MKKIISCLILLTLVITLFGCKPETITTHFSGEEGVTPPVSAETKLLTIPSEIENNCFGFVMGAPDEISLIAQIGAAWARPHPGPFAWGFIETEKNKFNFAMTDDYVQRAQENNVAILGTIWPYAEWDQQICRDSACEVSTKDIFYPEEKMGWKNGIPLSRCAPCNYEDYQNFITKLVERYDGDGLNDMPGLKVPLKYWEVLNEPEMKSAEMTFFKGSQEDYVKILQNTFETIKQVCPNCQVLHGGAAGTQSFMLNYWQKILEWGGGNYFDIANIHYINSGETSTLNVADFKNFLKAKGINKPLWLTEVEFGSESEIEKSVAGALQAGAKKIFFTQFKVGQFGLPENGDYSKAYDLLRGKCS